MQGMSTMKRIWPILLTVVATISATGNAQTLRIRLLDGRSGEPISNRGANIWVGDHRKAAVPIPGDRDGVTKLRLTDNAGQVNVEARAKRPTDVFFTLLR